MVGLLFSYTTNQLSALFNNFWIPSWQGARIEISWMIAVISLESIFKIFYQRNNPQKKGLIASTIWYVGWGILYLCIVVIFAEFSFLSIITYLIWSLALIIYLFDYKKSKNKQ